MINFFNVFVVIPYCKKANDETMENLKKAREIKKQQEDNEKRYKHEIKRFLENK
jgi:hypothetical protein